MAKRQDLNDKLNLLFASYKVYFQPPENKKLTYPCVIYKLAGVDIDYGDDRPYFRTRYYTVTVISRDPDFDLDIMLDNFENVSFDRSFVNDNLYHYVYRLYF